MDRSKPTGTVTTPPVASPGPPAGARFVSDLSDWVNCCWEVKAPGRAAPAASSPGPAGSVSVDARPRWPNSTTTAGRERRDLARSSTRPRLEETRLLSSSPSDSSRASLSTRPKRGAKLDGLKTSVRLIDSDIAQTLAKTADKGINTSASGEMTNSREAIHERNPNNTNHLDATHPSVVPK